MVANRPSFNTADLYPLEHAVKNQYQMGLDAQYATRIASGLQATPITLNHFIEPTVYC
jgi:hypothetical protein